MSELIFDGTTHQISLVDRNGNTIGTWPANNVVEQRGNHLPFVPNGTHGLIDRTAPHRHGGTDARGIPVDSTEGAYGSYGIVRLLPLGRHSGIGVHSGRAQRADGLGRVGPNHATQGCIRTTDEAMRAIAQTMRRDALTTITVRNNHAQ